MSGFNSKVSSSVSLSGWHWYWKAGTVVIASLAMMVTRRLWSNRNLDRKLEKKRERCRKSLKQIEQELNEHKLPVTERDAILSLSLSALQAKLQSGELKALDVLKAYQDKALELNARINCVVEAIPEAKEQAASCDRSGDTKRLLHGVPLSVKENLGIKGYDTTAGLQVNIGVPCDEDSVVVEVFKRHGAIPFVRTNIPQAMLSYTCSNPIFGMTLNPHNTDHCPGGSSGGEGAILGGGGSLIGLGTDVGGSVRVPAAFCGVCALKPTLGRFSKRGAYSVHKGRMLIAGVVGPLARDVDSLVTMTRVMASPDMFELDPTVPPLPFQEQLLKSSHRLRIGYFIWDGHLPPVPVVDRAVREAKAALQALGHTMVEFNPPDYVENCSKLFGGAMVLADQGTTLKHVMKGDYVDVGLKNGLALTKLPGWIMSLLAKLLQNKEPVLSTLLKHLKSDGTAYSWFQHAEAILDYRATFIREWRNLGLDAVICPVFPCPAPKSSHIGFLTVAGSSSCLYNLVNFPAGVVPVTKVTPQDVADVNNPELFQAGTRLEKFIKQSCDTEETVGLPVAVQCATLPFKEELCLRLLGELETALNYSSL